ncbi:universal stress protein [Saccharothrix algeriensis]|uniref:Nucleotide-binding universal stress UspA family protein n=1 Tax=Saccharothrix algeriensis TaxID=173560 RepID=A0A8T8HZU1_9PSEU|nr:universal stress protein [Saccharothrix algeriensis]MBM7809699.1 nucleotide-binding universal stress UspA family protein [Saccharothrix algeriensis]QTR03996.1 universal stress protein [Saccharothrix algeriensis]
MSGPVVVGVDGSGPAVEAVRWATAEARRRGVLLRLAHAEPPLPPDAPEPGARSRAALHNQAWQWLHEAADVARAIDPEVALSLHVEVAEPVRLLAAESTRARLVVLGSRGSGGCTALPGSTVRTLVGRSACPVVVVRGAQRTGPVVVGVRDDNPTLLAHAFDQAESRGARLVAVHARHAPPEAVAQGATAADRGGTPAAILAPWREKHPDVALEPVVARGTPVRALLDHARDASLLVIGCRNRAALTGLLPCSTSRALIHHAPCPVMVVRERAPGPTDIAAEP